MSLTTDYTGNKIYENGTLKRILTDNGYIEGGIYYFYVRDHLGNNRVVANASASAIQSTQYYPFGMAFAEGTTASQGMQPYKYNGKELDQSHGLNQYDYSARFYDPGYIQLPTPDPHAEKYYSWSPYVYCFNNPMRFTDPDGKDGFDQVLGFVAAFSDNVTLGFTNVRVWGATIASNSTDYNRGQDSGDLISIIVGGAMVDGGTAALGGAVVVTAGTGGTSSEISIPAAVGAISTIFQGASLVTQGTKNFESQKERATGGKYENVSSSKNTGEGKNFTPAHKKRLLEANRNGNGGELRSDLSGKKLDSPTQSKKGVKANMNQAEVDHVKAKSKGGTNASSNAQILSKEENLRKSNKSQ